MRREPQEFAEGLRLAAIAAVSAAATATLVIGAGRTLLPEAPAAEAARPELVRASLGRP
ncbi:hypothetical protein [Brevundimonas viscosa]|uniref:Uncharacterized protein n=1 Tax=Brevundimonas viscosa TaxID=871741 RepID=A0A1I6T4W6_9CAUL|nr:hypothetical protein [Brevundimonas viscosa]SFS84203.1 hypothetical protein SAMN05192570_2953 [Brevundimonas viscosa]